MRLLVAVSMTGSLVLAGLAPSAGATEESLVQPQATIPADLQALEQKMAQLHVNSERFSVAMDLSLELGKGAVFPLVIGGSGTVSESPQEGSFKVGLFGAGEESRLIGDTLYRHETSIAEYDGGRPWVRSTHSSLDGAIGVSPTAVIGQGAPSPGSFANLIEAVNAGESFLEVGPTIVEGRQVTEFEMTLNPENVFKSASKTMLQELSKQRPTAVKLELYISPDGLPVRTVAAIEVEHQTISIMVDILALEVPVAVKPPPARQTIDEARLNKLKRERAKCHSLRPRRRRKLAVCRGLGQEITVKLAK
jgi:hypothetical protein